MFLLHDNTPIHQSAVAQVAVQRSGIVELSQPPYSPDLAPSDFYLFGHQKKHLREKIFADKDELMQETTDFLNQQSPEWFKLAFFNQIRRWRMCAENNGGYVEK